MQSKPKFELNLVNGLILICVVVYLGQWIFPGLTSLLLFEPHLGYYQPWRFLSAAFLHGGLLHLACNMGFLYLLGQLSRRFWAQWQVLLVYLLCAWGGAFGTLVWARISDSIAPTVGASGAVLGLCAALFVFTRHLHSFSSSLGGLLVINLLIGFLVPNVAWHAHLGGALVGLGLGLGLRAVSVGAGRAGRKHLRAAIPDIVDQHRARQAVTRLSRLGNSAVFIGIAVLLGAATWLCYTA